MRFSSKSRPTGATASGMPYARRAHPSLNVRQKGLRLRAGLVCLASLFVSHPASASDPDPWFGVDKYKHFAACTVIAAAGYGIGTVTTDARYQALALGGGLAVGVGIGKEMADLAGMGNASYRDFTWDVIGAVVGLGLAWGVDLAVRGVSPSHPVLRPARSQAALAFAF